MGSGACLDEVIARCASTGDAAALSEAILRALAERGWARIQPSITFATFEVAAALLGPSVLRSEVRVDPEALLAQRARRAHDPDRPTIYAHEPLDFHTDHPAVPIVGWYCHVQDASDGVTELLDLGDIGAAFSPRDLAGMCRVHLRRGDCDEAGEESFRPHPLLTARGSGYHVYYTPWLTYDAYEPAEEALLEAFAAHVRRLSESARIRVRLAPGECLFIDNHRVLHARGLLSPESRRHLTRLYIGPRPG